MTLKRYFAWAGVIVGTAFLLIAKLFLYSNHDHDPAAPLLCVDVKPRWQSWTHRQTLKYARLNAAEIELLNDHGGAPYPASPANVANAERMLSLFISRGLDIHRGNLGSRDRMPLHDFAVAGDVERIRMLPRHGARTDIEETDSLTPLDIAERVQQKHRSEAKRSVVVQTLEADENKSRRTAPDR